MPCIRPVDEFAPARLGAPPLSVDQQIDRGRGLCQRSETGWRAATSGLLVVDPISYVCDRQPDWRDSGRYKLLDIEAILAIIFVLGVPSMALATHLVLRPLIREWARIKGLKGERDQLEARLIQLEDVVHDMDRQVNRLLEAERFRRELEAGPRGHRPAPDL